MWLGVAFSLIDGVFFPTVGLRTPGEIVEANFGQKPFVFDIETFIRVLFYLYFKHIIFYFYFYFYLFYFILSFE